mgnify:CR=1 FL=1
MGGGFLQRGLSKGGFTAGNGEWTDTGDVIHPGDASGDETLVIGGTTEAGADIILSKTGGAIFNEQSASVDFRVETNNQANAFLVDGSADSVKIGYNETIVPSAEPASATNVLHNLHLGLADIDEGNQLRITFTIGDLSANQFQSTFDELRFFQATLYVLGNYHPSGSATDLRYSGLYKIDVGALYEDRSHITTTLLSTTSSAGGWTALTTGNVAVNSAGDTSVTIDIDNPQSTAHMDYSVWVQFAHNCSAIALSEVAA